MTILLFAGLLLGQTLASPEQVEVRAKRSLETLNACIERRCPTPDDIDASISHAEAQFVAGEYHDARRTLMSAIGRQRKNAAEYPRAPSTLYSANATLNIHLGDMAAFRTWSGERARTLRKYLPETDPQVRILPLQLGDTQLRLRNVRAARIQYDNAIGGYRRQGDDRLAALTALRAAAVELQLRNFVDAHRKLELARSSPAANDPTVAVMSAVVAARLASARGDEGQIERLLQTLRTQNHEPPVLLTDLKTLSFMRGAPADATGLTEARPTAELISWVDIGFLVQPDGSVADVEVLRGSRSRGWTNALVQATSKRQYVPIDVPVGSPGLYRVERVTWRPERIRTIGSHIATASGAMDIEILDLTENAAPPPDEATPRVIRPV